MPHDDAPTRPADVAAKLDLDPSDFDDTLRLTAAVKWHEMGKLSLEEAASLAGVDRQAFEEALERMGVSLKEDGMSSEDASPNVVWEGLNIEREQREARNGHQAAVVWFTGLSGSGKTTIAREVEKRLFGRGVNTMLLDGDYVRHGLSSDLEFSPQDRTENIRRVGEVARLFFEQGCLTLCSFISPYADNRAAIADLFPDGRFLEIHVDADLDTLTERDTKGLYTKAQAGEIDNFTGISAPYEAPEHPALRLDTTTQDQDTCVQAVLDLLEDQGLIAAA